jgi:SAM-dependent methyltransferase
MLLMDISTWQAIGYGTNLTPCAWRSARADSNLLELIPPKEGDASRATAETLAAYAQSASRYADATENYELYPGLRDAVVAFSKSAVPGLPVLDLGCGGGRDSLQLAALGSRVVAGDLCMPLVERVKAATSDYFLAAAVCLNICDLPFRSSSLGGVWACGSLLHLPSREIRPSLIEILRVLAPGGIASINMQIGSVEGWRHGGSLAGRRWFTLIEPDTFVDIMSSVGYENSIYNYVGRSGWFQATGRKPLSSG